MFFLDPRRLLLLCAGLDLLCFLALVVAVSLFKQPTLQDQLPWLVFSSVTYLGLGWLFGSYTVLRCRRLPPVAVFQRVFITGLVTAVVLALGRMIFNPADTVAGSSQYSSHLAFTFDVLVCVLRVLFGEGS